MNEIKKKKKKHPKNKNINKIKHNIKELKYCIH